MVVIFKKTHKPIIRLDDTKYNGTKARVLLLLLAVRETDGQYMTRQMLANNGAASEGYLRGRLWWLEQRDYVSTRPIARGRHAKGRGYLKGYRITSKGMKYVRALFSHYPKRMEALCHNLGITIIRE